MEQEGKEGRATPYEDALSALALEHDDDDDARAHHQQQQQQREWAEGEEHQTPGVAEREDTSTPSASAAPAGASIPTDVSIDAAVPADFDNDGLSDQGSSCPSPSSPLLLLDPSKAKHMLVLSSAGKPIFSRHGDEQRLAPLMGMAQAIISLTAAAGKQGGGDEEEGPAGSDCVRFITTSDGRKFVFLARGELYLLAVAHTREPEPYLKLQLDYLYQQARAGRRARRVSLHAHTHTPTLTHTRPPNHKHHRSSSSSRGGASRGASPPTPRTTCGTS